MKATPQHQHQRRETAVLIERAQRLLLESRKLLEQREAQLKHQEQFVEQRAMITNEILGNHRRQSQESRLEFGLGLSH